jgi:glutamine cyclotransferase
MYKIKIALTIITASIVLFASCKSEEKNKQKKEVAQNNNSNTIKKEKNPLILTITEQNKKYVVGDIISISISESKISNEDTITLLINDEETAKLSLNNSKYEWKTKNSKVGKNIIEIELNKNKKHFRKTKNIILLSNIIPEKYTYKVKNVYKHDVNAYTQGLFFHNGFLYEATGLKGKSTIRKVKLETGEVIHSFTIPTDVFGEGIVLFNDKIIQISWQAGKGFVYDFETFNVIDEFSYTGEGWGICTDDKNLFMTNGSAEIMVLETQSYSTIKTLQAYDNKGAVIYLNELEYINGFIYANIYQYEKIAKIDPTNGKVLAYIDLKGILPMNDYTSKTDVLNGIAYDKNTNKIFVTGKNWPKLFEVEFKHLTSKP